MCAFLQKEQMYINLTKCHTEIINYLGKIVSTSHQHIEELNRQNAAMKEYLKDASDQETVLEEVIILTLVVECFLH